MKCSLSEKEINNLISLLHKDYQNLPVEVIGIGNAVQRLKYKWRVFLDYAEYPDVLKSTINQQILGCYMPLSNFIFIDYGMIRKLCNWPEEDIESIFNKKKWIAFIFFHEIRHAYQYHIKKMEREFKKFDSPFLEKDANLFAYRMMNKHKEKIREILYR